MHPNRITEWKKELLAGAGEVFENDRKQEAQEADVKEISNLVDTILGLLFGGNGLLKLD